MQLNFAELVYWAAVLAFLHTWAFYLLFLVIFSGVRKIKTDNGPVCPGVTILVTVHNEEALIEKRVRNLMETDYPEGMLEIIVASDGSSDRTNELVDSMGRLDSRIRLFACEKKGKSATQNRAIPLAKGEIVVLTDAGTLFEKDTVRNLVRNFADRGVGCVSGKLLIGAGDNTISESQGAYWKFEMLLRALESRAGLLHTASGGVMAFRKSLFAPFDCMYGDDCIIPLDIISQGYRVVHEERSVAYDSFPSSLEGELKARTRMTLRNITCTLSRPGLLNPFKHPLISFSIISHKIMRWLTPCFMISILTLNMFLLDQSFYKGMFLCQVFFYALALVGLVAEKNGWRVPLASPIFSFVLANAGFLIGTLKAVSGRKVTSYGT